MASMFRFVNLTSLDLSGFDMSKVTKADDMIYSDSLIALETPRNLNVSIPLRGTWITDQGFICTTLLQHTDKSIHLKQRPELVVEKRKTEYFVGDTLDLSDLTVTLYYNFNNRTTTTDYTTNAAQIDMNTPGTKYLVISKKRVLCRRYTEGKRFDRRTSIHKQYISGRENHIRLYDKRRKH